MDYKNARSLLIDQGLALDENSDALLIRLRNFKPPVPGQVTNILLALKMLFESLPAETTIDRELACALFQLAYESRQYYEAGKAKGISWPPLLDEDLHRIALGVRNILAGTWLDL